MRSPGDRVRRGATAVWIAAVVLPAAATAQNPPIHPRPGADAPARDFEFDGTSNYAVPLVVTRGAPGSASSDLDGASTLGVRHMLARASALPHLVGAAPLSGQAAYRGAPGMTVIDLEARVAAGRGISLSVRMVARNHSPGRPLPLWYRGRAREVVLGVRIPLAGRVEAPGWSTRRRFWARPRPHGLTKRP